MGGIGRLLVALGAALLVLGAVLMLVERWWPSFGRLPGDVRIEGQGWGCWMPLVSSLLLSVILSLLLTLILGLWRR